MRQPRIRLSRIRCLSTIGRGEELCSGEGLTRLEEIQLLQCHGENKTQIQNGYHRATHTFCILVQGYPGQSILTDHNTNHRHDGAGKSVNLPQMPPII